MKFEMPLTAYQITDRLLKVIDKETGKVTDLSMTLEIIIMLEKTTITKDELEETRLGKYINLVRKAAKDPTLQKRAKKLIKSWQIMISKTMQKPKVVDTPSVAAAEKATKNLKENEKQKTFNNNLTVEEKIKPNIPPNNSKRKYDSISETKETVLNKEKNASSPGESSFTCMTNGLKLKFTSLSSSSSSAQLLNDDTKQNKPQSKRKKSEKKIDSTISKEVQKNKLNSAIKSFNKLQGHLPEKQSSNVLEVQETLKVPKIEKDTVHKEEKAIKSKHFNIGIDPNESTMPQKDDNQWSGVTGCRGTNGTWYSWTDSIYLNRTDNQISGGDEPEVLNILPYVELD